MGQQHPLMLWWWLGTRQQLGWALVTLSRLPFLPDWIPASVALWCIGRNRLGTRQGSGAVNPVSLCFSMRVHCMTVSKAMRTGVVTAGIREMTCAKDGAV